MGSETRMDMAKWGVLATVFLMRASFAIAVVIEVAPGDDLTAVRNRVRAERRDGGTVEVLLGDGVYEMTNGLWLAAQDSNVVWRARNPGKAVIVGGRAFRGRVFHGDGNGMLTWSVPDDVKGKFAFRSLSGRPTYIENRWVPKKARTRYPILTIDGRTMQMARWPNAPRYHWPKRSDVLRRASKGTNQVLRVPELETRRWNMDAADIWMYGFLEGCAYEQHPSPVLGYNAELGGFEMNDGHGSDAVAPSADCRFFFLNVLEEVDEPGEWCYDRRGGEVRLVPPEGFGEDSLVAIGFMDSPAFVIEADEVVLEGLKFTAFIGNPVVVIQSCSRSAVRGCVFSGLGLDGVFLSGSHNEVRSCDFRDVASICVGVHGGDVKTLTGGFNTVENCHCENFCTMRESWGRGAIHLFGGLYNRAAHNLIHGSTEHGLDYYGFGHVVEYNRIYDVSTEFGDSAAVYSQGGLTSYGCVFRYNDVGTSPGYSMAFYADDFSSGHEVYGNIFRNYGYYGAFFGGGRDNTISNNIFTAGWGGTRIDNRGLFWPGYKDVEGLYTNVLVKRYDFEKGPVARRWPKFSQWHSKDGKLMCGYWDNVWCNNLFLDISGYSSSINIAMNRKITDPSRLRFENNLVVRTKGLPDGAIDMERGVENVPTNAHGRISLDYIGKARILEGTPENPIDLGFVDVPPPLWDASEYMLLSQGWIDVPKLQELRAMGRTRGVKFKVGDFSQKPNARIDREIPGWVEIPFRKIGLFEDRWRRSMSSGF